MEDNTQTLVALGLTVLQARAYLNLVKIGTARAGIISKFSGVGRQDIYRILTELQDLGLVKKIFTMPTEFEPMPIEQGLSLLLKHRDDETSKLRKEATLLSLDGEQIKSNADQKDSKLSVIHGYEIADFEFIGVIKKSQKCIKILTNTNKIRRDDQAWRVLLESFKRNPRVLEIKIMATKVENVTPLPEVMEKLGKNIALQIRQIPYQIPCSLTICDSRVVLVQLIEENSQSKVTHLCLESPRLAIIFGHYFDTLWKESAPIITL